MNTELRFEVDGKAGYTGNYSVTASRYNNMK